MNTKCAGCGDINPYGIPQDQCLHCLAPLCLACMEKGHCGHKPAESWAEDCIRSAHPWFFEEAQNA